MKKSVFIFLALLACTIYPVRAYEYFTIYFSDGTKSEAFYATDVDSICYSKFSLDSIECNEWKVQEIYARSNVYRYALEDIEKIEFKDVDESVVAENIANVSSFVAPYFATCESTDELSQYLPEILSTEGVEKAWVDDITLFIKIVDFGIIQFSYNPKRSTASSTDNNPANSRTRSLDNKFATNQNTQVYFPNGKPKNMCIYYQVANDSAFSDVHAYVNDIETFMTESGIKVKAFDNKTTDFFSEKIYDYDLVFIITHGSYDGNRHWLLTLDKLWESPFTLNLTKKDLKKLWEPSEKDKKKIENEFLKRPSYSPDKMSICYHLEKRSNNSNDYALVAYTNISEDYIDTLKNFKNKSIIFCTACTSMEKNHSLANKFITNGAGCYFGYNEENSIGHRAGYLFFNYLLNGKSAKSAYNEMENEAFCYVHEIQEDNNYKFTASLENEFWGSLSNIRIFEPRTEEPNILKESDTVMVQLTGVINTSSNQSEIIELFDKKVNGYYKNLREVEILFDNKNNYDFLISDNPQMTDPDSLSNIQLSLEDEMPVTYKWEGVLKEFKKKPLETGKTYYYCARLNDGYDNCYGEVKEFTIPEKNDNVIQTLPVEKGEITPLPEREFFNLCNYHLRFNGKINSPSFIADYKSPTGFTMDKYELGFLISDNPNMENAENVYVYGKRGSHRYYQDLSYNEEDNSVSFAYDHNCSITENKKMYCQAYLYLIDKSGQYTEKLFGELVEYENGFRICPDDNHPHMIDLGLPSGTKWACCNVGSSAPWEDGGLYAWGESVEKEEYTQNNYSLAGLKYAENNTGVAMSFPLFDLQDSDYRKYDTASVLWGETWQMPNNDQAEELFREIDIHNPVYYYNDNYNQGGAAYNRRGEVFKGPNGNYILIPRGDHWTSTGSDQTSGTVRARNVAKTFHWSRDETYYRNADEIYFGHHVRPVAK